MCACVCVHVCPYACVCVIYGSHPSDDQSSCYCSRRSVNLSQGSPTDSSSTLEDNPQCIHKQFTVKSSVGSEWPPGVNIGGGNGTASTATAVPKFDKWGLSRTKVDSEQFQYQPVFIQPNYSLALSLVSS